MAGFDETFNVPAHSFDIADYSTWTYSPSDIGTTFTVTVQVDDNDGGVDSDTFDVTVVEDTLRVIDFQSNASGFDVTFNRAPNLSDLNLYDSLLDVGSPTVLEAPDVTLVRNGSEQILGSMVWAADTNTLTFVKTGGVLAAGNYDVTLVSSADGFHDGSNLLDGDGDFDDNEVGDDFTTSFVVNTPPVDNRVVSLGDFARGAGQDVNVPTVEVGGSDLPIYIDNANGVQAVDVDVLYDPTLLHISAALLGAGPTGSGGWSITTNSMSIDATHTLLKITVSGTAALSGSNVELIKLDADVPSTAPYGASQVIRLQSLRVNEDLIPSQADFAIHKAVYVGDADGDGAYGGTDAGLISRVVVSLDSGFDAHDWTDPRIVGDASGDGTLSGLDASYVAQEAVFIDVPEVPPIPGVSLIFSATGVDPEYSISEDIPATQGGTVTVPVELNVLPAETVVGATFHVYFDDSLLTFDDATAGAFWSSVDGWSITGNLSAAGRVTVAMYNTMGNTSAVGQGVIADLDFSVSGSAQVGDTSPLDVQAANPNEGGLTWSDGSDGSVVFTSALTGDYNQNSVVDAADYVLWRKQNNTSVPNYSGADGTGNGFVDGGDYSLWQENFGQAYPGSGAGSATLASSPVIDDPLTPQSLVTSSLVAAGSDAQLVETVGPVSSPAPAAAAARVEGRAARDEAVVGFVESLDLPESLTRHISSQRTKSSAAITELAHCNLSDLLFDLSVADKPNGHKAIDTARQLDSAGDASVDAVDELFAELDSESLKLAVSM